VFLYNYKVCGLPSVEIDEHKGYLDKDVEDFEGFFEKF
jgi:hypothetical protein